MKNYLESLEELAGSKNILIPGLMLFGINVGLLAGFLAVYSLLSLIQKLILSSFSYPLLPAIAVITFVIICLKVWYDFGALLRQRFVLGEKLKKMVSESLVIDIIGLLPFLFLLLLNNLITSLKVIANPGAVTGELMTNTIIATGALIVQVLIAEIAVLKKRPAKAAPRAIETEEQREKKSESNQKEN